MEICEEVEGLKSVVCQCILKQTQHSFKKYFTTSKEKSDSLLQQSWPETLAEM